MKTNLLATLRVFIKFYLLNFTKDVPSNKDLLIFGNPLLLDPHDENFLMDSSTSQDTTFFHNLVYELPLEKMIGSS